MKKKVGVLGDGGMAVRCVEKLLQSEQILVPLLVYHSDSSAWTSALQSRIEALGVTGMAAENVNDPAVRDALAPLRPDLLLSVNNFDIIKADLLAMPKDGIINFHNGPLPDYRGVNIPSWAIINGETEHGVCWHYVDDGIDTGDIVASSRFSIDERETAISLIMKCIECGIDILDDWLDRYIAGSLTGVAPGEAGRYFSRKMTPDDGFLDFACDYDRLSAVVRGLSFHPFENDFTHPKVRTAKTVLIVSEIEHVESSDIAATARQGEVVDIDDRGIAVRAGVTLVRLCGLMTEDFVPVSRQEMVDSCGVNIGTLLVGHRG